MLANQRLQFDNQSRVQTESQIRVNSILECSQSQLLQPGRLNGDERRVTDIGQRWTAPQRKGLAQGLGRVLRWCSTRGDHQALEPHGIDGLRIEVEHVSRRPGDDPLCAQQASELRDV